MNKLKFNLNILFSLLLLINVFYSCNDDFLDRPPKDAVDAEFFFNTPKDLEVATNDFYLMLPEERAYTEDMWSDNIVLFLPKDRVDGTRLVPVGRGNGNWSWTWLRRINFFLENYKKVDDIDAQNHYSGVAKFFRAFFYFDKVQRFGDVPWYNKVLEADDKDELTKPRDSRKLVMDSVLADIDYAIQYLPAEKQLNRVTKYTAMLLKARLALFEGTFRKYHNLGDDVKFLEEAVSASQALMDSKAYTLYTSGGKDKAYGDLFTKTVQDPTETILATSYVENIKTHNIPNYMVSATSGGWGLPKDLVESYLMADGSRFTDKPGYNTMGFYQEMQNRDPRLTQTTAGPDFKVIGETVADKIDLRITSTGYRVIKALPDRYQWNSCFSDIIMYRYAEALLIYAEAKAELGTLTQTDLDKSINLLRARVGMPHLSLAVANANPDSYLEAMYPNVNKGANKGVILEIRRERRIELYNEGLRWNDLMRWKEGKKIERPMLGIYFSGLGSHDFNNDGKTDVYLHSGNSSGAPAETQSLVNINERPLTNGNSGNINAFSGGVFDEDKDYYFPIPLEDLTLNPNLEQNPKWN